MRVAVAGYSITMCAYLGFSFGFGFFWIYAKHPPKDFDKGVGVSNIVIYVPFNLFKVYLTISFWRLGIRFLRILKRTEIIKETRYYLFLAFVGSYLSLLFLCQAVYWAYPAYYKLKE